MCHCTGSAVADPEHERQGSSDLLYFRVGEIRDGMISGPRLALIGSAMRPDKAEPPLIEPPPHCSNT